MANLRTVVFSLAIIILSLCATSICSAYFGGTGEPNNPYQIADSNNWQQLMNDSNNWNKQFILTADIDLAGIILKPVAPVITGCGNSIGPGFKGIFDGGSHVIRNVKIKSYGPEGVGLFGYIDYGGQIKNLRIEDANVIGIRLRGVGVIAAINAGSMSNCYATGAVSGLYEVGGLVGENIGSLSNCYTTCAASGEDGVGGLVGGNGGSINNCYTTCIVNGIDDIGGLVGANGGSVTSCHSACSVTGTGNFIGGLVGSNGSTLSDCYATGDVAGTGNHSASIGGLCGINGNTHTQTGTISHCYATGHVSGNGDAFAGVGGLVGNNTYVGTVTASYATGNVTGVDSIGGLAGTNSGTMISCYATGSVSGASSYSMQVGGLCGSNRSYCSNIVALIRDCHSTGSVSGVQSIGGLVGQNDFYSSVTSCYATGSVSGQYSVGGLMGANELDSTVASCYATGSVTGTNEQIGGLLGHNDGTVTSCYATGAVSGTGSYVGGLIGISYYYGSVTISFWDTETSGQGGSSGGKGLTTIQMKTLATFQNAGWGTYGWVMSDGVDYPRLNWEGTGYPAIPPTDPTIPLTGSGTQADPYQIRTPADFSLLSWYPAILDKYILLMSDINVADETLYPIGDISGSFTGVFDGNGHVIHNCVINIPSGNYVGLFGYVGSDGQINNLGVVDANITGRDSVGGLAGSNEGDTISECFVTGSVRGQHNVGGLVGVNSGSVRSCCATSSVAGNDYVGGLVGFDNMGKVIRSYSAGKPTGASNVGGLCGGNTTGGGYEDTGNFWDTQASQMAISAMGEGKATAEMKTESTFTAADWDFVNVWWMHVGNYPQLIWDHKLYSGGSGTQTEPYKISTAVDWYKLTRSSSDWGKCFLLMSDIDMAGINLMSVGNASARFNGIFDGNFHIIRNATIYLPDNYSVGLFGITGPGGQIKNLGVENVNITGKNSVGGLIGNNWYCTVTSCYVTGLVSGNDYVGGLAGFNNMGKVIRCYSVSTPAGTSNVGGLCGDKFTGGDYEDTGNFWDTQASQTLTSVMGTGKTTAEMRMRSTFTGEGWDFTTIWAICEGTNYPRMQSQILQGDWVCPEGINMEDMDDFASHWLMDNCASANNCDGADLNIDGTVDFYDYAIFAGHWLEGI